MRRIHPILSLQARYRTWLAGHFETSRYGKQLKKYKNLHKGEACFILGNGPSLNAKDLDELHRRGVVTFAMNRVYHIFPETEWRPTYYVCEDELIVQEKQTEIQEIPARAKFLPIELSWYHGVSLTEVEWFHINYRAVETINEHGFSDNMAKELGCRGTVTFTCMQIAAYMGFAEIYLLGVDHNYHITIDEDGNVVVDPDAADYFCKDYDKDIIDKVVHDMGNNTRTYRAAKAHCERLGRPAIYNATRGGKLEVFPRRDFDQLMAEWDAKKVK